MYVLQNIHWFLLLLLVLVFVHEWGHFVVAKCFNIKVTHFSIGFGPRLVRWVRGETEYRIGLLPLGGYVKMVGEVPGAQVDPEDEARSFMAKPAWQRALVALAGPLANALLAAAVYAWMAYGVHEVGEARVGVLTRSGPAWNAGLLPGDVLVQINGHLIQDWDGLRKEVSAHPNENLEVVYKRGNAVLRTVVKTQSHTEHNALAELETRGKIGVSLQYVQPYAGVVDEQSPVYQAGIRTGDKIEQVQGHPVLTWYDVKQRVQEAAASEPLVFKIQRGEQHKVVTVAPVEEVPQGYDVSLMAVAEPRKGYLGLVSEESLVHRVDSQTPASRLGLLKGDRLVGLELQGDDGVWVRRGVDVWSMDLSALSGVSAKRTCVVHWQRGAKMFSGKLVLQEHTEKDALKNTHTTYVFGAYNNPNTLGTYTVQRRIGLAETVSSSFEQVWEDASMIVRGVVKMVKGDVPLNAVGGPMMLFVVAEKSAKRGKEYFLRMLGMISVNLGVVNLFPIPVLDGGHIAFCVMEMVRRKPPSLRAREIANAVGLALLAALMLLSFSNDFIRFVLG
jgi:regulator of sigma E protease